jgi:hypothetical protein
MAGAGAVEALRIYRIATMDPNLFHWPYIFLSLAFALGGGVFAVAWDEEHPMKAMYLGATFSIWLSAWARI